jgi:hypothetical protein
MKLSAWLKKNDATHQSFTDYANMKGVMFSRHAVAKWCNGQRIPRKDEMESIYRLTKKEVQPNDFYNIHLVK